MLRSILVLAVCGYAFVLPLQSTQKLGMRFSDMVEGADCVEAESCSVEELEALLAEVKAKAEDIKALEAKLSALNKDDSATLKKMIQAEECELNGFDGCSAWYYDD